MSGTNYIWRENVLLKNGREISSKIRTSVKDIDKLYEYVREILDNESYMRLAFPDTGCLILVRTSEIAAVCLEFETEESE